jgi:hypothetical protein
MRLPGFTAEAWLCPAAGDYALEWSASPPAYARVVPQIRRLIPFFDGRGCLCLGVEDFDRGYSYVAGCVCD